MSRKKFFLTGLASSYGLIGLNFLYTLVSIPLVLRYLSQAEFGVWALVAQFSNYLLLIDLGASASVSRLLADHKDRKDSPEYGRVFYASFLVSGIQALVLLGLGGLAAWLAPSLAKIPDELRAIFSCLLLGYVSVTAVSLAFRSLGSPLWSHQRLDISNLGNALGLFLNLIGLWAGLHAGMGLYGMLLGAAIGVLPGLIIPFTACRFLGYYPHWPGFGQLGKINFGELFSLSRDIFMFQVGSQLASATQIILVSRFLSVESAATWAIATKAFTLGQQLCNRIMDASAAAFTEMFVRNERQRLVKRLGQIVEATAWFSTVVGSAIIFFNSPFVDFWTGGRIVWPARENIWLALLLLSTCTARCYLSLGGITKNMSTLRWVQIVEGLTMLGISMWLLNKYGFSAVLIGSLAANLCITLTAGIWLTSQSMTISIQEIVRWTWPSFFILLVGGLMLIGMTYLVSSLCTDIGQVAIRFFLMILISVFSFRFCLRDETRREMFLRFFCKRGADK